MGRRCTLLGGSNSRSSLVLMVLMQTTLRRSRARFSPLRTTMTRTLAIVGHASLVHHLSGCDCSKWCKFLAQFVIINGVIQIFYKQIDTGVPVEALHFERFELFL